MRKRRRAPGGKDVKMERMGVWRFGRASLKGKQTGGGKGKLKKETKSCRSRRNGRMRMRLEDREGNGGSRTVEQA